MKLCKTMLATGLLSMMMACGASVQNSSLDGHYENATAAAMERYKGKQVVVPEYAPVDKVIVGLPIITSYGREDLIEAILNAGVDEVLISYNGNVNQAVFNNLRTRLGERIQQVSLVKHETRSTQPRDAVTVWARDWAPLGAVITDGPAQGDLRLVDFNYYLSREFDDFSPQAYARVLTKERVSVPVYNEGGNFMNNDAGDCMMTTRVVYANSRAAYAAGMHPNDKVMDEAEIAYYYKEMAGCERVFIFDRMPYEGTGHIDLWAKFLDNNTVMVSQVTQETLAAIRSSANRAAAENIQKFLEARAAEITRLGYKVVRVPLPAPNVFSDSSAVVRSYTNSLLVNGVAIVPRYQRASGFNYEDSYLLAAYERTVEQVYRAAGYQVVWINSDSLISNGGAVHCVTMQLPRL